LKEWRESKLQFYHKIKNDDFVNTLKSRKFLPKKNYFKKTNNSFRTKIDWKENSRNANIWNNTKLNYLKNFNKVRVSKENKFDL